MKSCVCACVSVYRVIVLVWMVSNMCGVCIVHTSNKFTLFKRDCIQCFSCFFSSFFCLFVYNVLNTKLKCCTKG